MSCTPTSGITTADFYFIFFPRVHICMGLASLLRTFLFYRCPVPEYYVWRPKIKENKRKKEKRQTVIWSSVYCCTVCRKSAVQLLPHVARTDTHHHTKQSSLLTYGRSMLSVTVKKYYDPDAYHPSFQSLPKRELQPSLLNNNTPWGLDYTHNTWNN